MPKAEYQGFTVVQRHDCKRDLPNAARFIEEHRGQILMCDYCKAKWSVSGSTSGDRWTYWWDPYLGTVEELDGE